jgi:hypothetical protein
MINEQYRKKSLKRKLPYKTIRRRPNSQNHRQKKKKKPFLEQRQSLTIKNRLHHKKLLGFKEEQNIYTTNRTTRYIDDLTRQIYYWTVHSSISFTPTSKRHHQILDGDQLPTNTTTSSSMARTSQSISSSLLLLRTIKSTPIKSTSSGGMEMGLTAGTTARSSSRKNGTGFDVPTGGASSTAGASRAPRADDASDKDADAKNLRSMMPS